MEHARAHQLLEALPVFPNLRYLNISAFSTCTPRSKIWDFEDDEDDEDEEADEAPMSKSEVEPLLRCMHLESLDISGRPMDKEVVSQSSATRICHLLHHSSPMPFDG